MQKTWPWTLIVLLLSLYGCAHQPAYPPFWVWDYERDEIGSREGQDTDRRHDDRRDDYPAGTIGGSIRYGLPLPPTTLYAIFIDALSRPQVASTAASSDQPYARAMATWAIVDTNEGRIITDWRPVSGREAGLLWWAREIQAQVQHIITVERSFRFSACANFSILTKVRERPNANYGWKAADPELGRASLEAIRRILLDSVQLALNAGRTTHYED